MVENSEEGIEKGLRLVYGTDTAAKRAESSMTINAVAEKRFAEFLDNVKNSDAGLD